MDGWTNEVEEEKRAFGLGGVKKEREVHRGEVSRDRKTEIHSDALTRM